MRLLIQYDSKISEYSDTSLSTNAMISSCASPTSIPANLGKEIHLSLLGVAATIEKSEITRKLRLGLAREFLKTINSWSKTQAGPKK